MAAVWSKGSPIPGTVWHPSVSVWNLVARHFAKIRRFRGVHQAFSLTFATCETYRLAYEKLLLALELDMVIRNARRSPNAPKLQFNGP